jgi:hypothetical protein
MPTDVLGQVDFLFNWRYYLQMNPDLGVARIATETQALEHFTTHGINEGRVFNPFVDLNVYRQYNYDLRGMSPRQLFNHLRDFGIKEGRIFSSLEFRNFGLAKFTPSYNLYQESLQNIAVTYVTPGNIFNRADAFDRMMQLERYFNDITAINVNPTSPQVQISNTEPYVGILTNEDFIDTVRAAADGRVAYRISATDVFNINAYKSSPVERIEPLVGNIAGDVFVSAPNQRGFGFLDISIVDRSINPVNPRTNQEIIDWYIIQPYQATYGGKVNDSLTASNNSRSAYIDGGAGNDTLTGRSNGAAISPAYGDVLVGGADSDTFVATERYLLSNNFIPGTFDPDLIADFRPAEGDRIDVRPLLANYGLRGGNLVNRGIIQQQKTSNDVTMLFFSPTGAPLNLLIGEGAFFDVVGLGNRSLIDSDFIS